MKERVGLILAGGKGTRLLPLTRSISKQLLPVYDKPMVFYPLYTLKQFGIKEVLIICMPDQLELFKQALGDGSEYEMEFTYKIQEEPRGLADAFLIGEEFIGKRDVTLILGDNIFIGNEFIKHITLSNQLNFGTRYSGNFIVGYKVKNPQQYGVFEFVEPDGHPDLNVLKSILEKPRVPPSDYAATGLYIFDNTAVEKAKKVKPSARGEIEIVDIINQYIEEGRMSYILLGEGEAWFDCGTKDDLLDCATYLRSLKHRANVNIGL